jgi:hypothetical protein
MAKMKLAHAGVVLKEVPHKGNEINSSTRYAGLSFRVGTGLTYFMSFLLVGSATAKLVHAPKVVITQMAGLGFDGKKMVFIAVLEIISALLFAYPRTRTFGLLMVSAYLGGAIAAHVGHDQTGIQPAIVLALVWLGTWLRNPEMLGSRK